MTHLIFMICGFFYYGQSLSLCPPTDVWLPTNKFESSYPYITGNTVRECCDHKLDIASMLDTNSIKTGDTIFVMTDYLDYFFTSLHPVIAEPYILITHNFYDTSDSAVPAQFASYLNDKKLIAWFTQNIDVQHPKAFPLPIGLACANFPHGNTKTFDIYIKQGEQNSNRKKLLYMNFEISSFPKERQIVYDLFKSKNFCSFSRAKSLAEYLHDLSEHKFVLSPRGNGLDTHRTWEALLMGCYPIVKSSSLNPLYQDLPVVIIDDWSEITEQFLEEKYKELVQREYKWEKLYMPYWLNSIENIKILFKSSSKK